MVHTAQWICGNLIMQMKYNVESYLYFQLACQCLTYRMQILMTLKAGAEMPYLLFTLKSSRYSIIDYDYAILHSCIL